MTGGAGTLNKFKWDKGTIPMTIMSNSMGLFFIGGATLAIMANGTSKFILRVMFQVVATVKFKWYFSINH
jgi:hypothetical protein